MVCCGHFCISGNFDTIEIINGCSQNRKIIAHNYLKTSPTWKRLWNRSNSHQRYITIDLTRIKDTSQRFIYLRHQRWIHLLHFLENPKQTVQHVSFGSIEDMFQRQWVKMNGETISFLVKKLYRDIPCFQVILEESNCSLYALFRSLEKIKTNIYKSYKVQREPFEG